MLFALGGPSADTGAGSRLSGSRDPDGDPLSYQWQQTAGPAVTLDLRDPVHPTFLAPVVASGGARLRFELTVSDGELASAPDSVDITVKDVNHAPTADAGPDQTADEGTTVRLDGTASRDSDSDPLTATWTQVGGTAVTLSDRHSLTPTFTAPSQPSHGRETLAFRLEVEDGLGGRAADAVAVTVLDVNAPPACGLAQVTPILLWPPNHKLVSVGLVGVADPDDAQVTLTVMGVMQDEPVKGQGGGDTSPDAVLRLAV